MNTCNACNKPESEAILHLCSVCFEVKYCGTKCQKSDFSTHKPACMKKGVIALLAAIDNNNELEVRRLIRTKYVLNGKVNYTVRKDATLVGWTALHHCVRGSKYELLEILVHAPGVKLEIKDGDGETPLYVAASNGHRSMQILIDAGANPNILAVDGWTPIMMAVQNGDYDHTRLLLQAGANLYLSQDMLGRNAFSLAKQFASGVGGTMMQGETDKQMLARYQKVFRLIMSHL